MYDREHIKNICKEISILFIDDEVDVISSMERILRSRFKESYTATNGEEGLAIYNDKLPDVIVTDITMPKMDGLTLAKHLKDIDSSIKIVITTGHSEKDYINKIESLNIPYIIKPISTKKLFNIIVELFDE
jgi:YesN/AraC family two-component response regulator